MKIDLVRFADFGGMPRLKWVGFNVRILPYRYDTPALVIDKCCHMLMTIHSDFDPKSGVTLIPSHMVGLGASSG